MDNFTFGFVPNQPDSRDFKFKASLTALPDAKSIDLSDGFRSIRNQGKLSSCTAFASTSIVEYIRKKQKLIDWQASPLFTYYTTRELANDVANDSGACIRNVLKSIVNVGVTKEDNWVYDETKVYDKPPQNLYEDATKHQALVYCNIERTKEDILSCLAEGYPFIFGMALYESFIRTQCKLLVYDRLPMPDVSKEKLIGWHCMAAVGYIIENDKTFIKVRNSWGQIVGLDGYHYVPIEYFLDPSLSLDFWTVKKEEYTDEEVIPEPVAPVIPVAPVAPVVPITPPAPIVEPVIPPFSEEKISIWKDKRIWVMLGFVVISLLFVLLK